MGWFSSLKHRISGGGASAPEALLPGTLPNTPAATTKARGDAAEGLALAHLERAGLKLAARNFKTPGRGGGEVDLVMWDARGTERALVFVEVRQRSSTSHGGAAQSVSTQKQRRIVLAARHYLQRVAPLPPCRFDVVTVGALERLNPHTKPQVEWLEAAFDLGA